MRVRTIYKTTNLARKHPSMTYILGAKCDDGVVLVADTRFTVIGKHPVYDDKITGEVPGILTAFSGSKEPFEEFRMRFRDYIVTAKEQNKEITIDRLLINIGSIMDYLYIHYGNYEFDLLLAMTAKPSFLYYFYQDGRPEAVKNFKSIGSGQDHGLLYLNRYYDENKTMDEIADLGYFIIRYIEKFNLDSGVGTGKERPNPLIIFIPNDKMDTKPSREDYARYEKNARIRLQKIEKSLLKDYTV